MLTTAYSKFIIAIIGVNIALLCIYQLNIRIKRNNVFKPKMSYLLTQVNGSRSSDLMNNVVNKNGSSINVNKRTNVFKLKKSLKPQVTGTNNNNNMNKWNEDDINMYVHHKIYRDFNITKPRIKKKVNLLLIVSSGPRRYDRRLAIRETWWQDCKDSFGIKVVCLFFTDQKKPGEEFYETLKNESRTYKDIRFQPLHGGIEFGMRFLFHMIWALTHYDFDYFMRVDDDQFFCVERFLYELPIPMIHKFHWGWTHCVENIIRPEESLILLSKDLIELYASQDENRMRCHPWADQMIGLWTTDLKINEGESNKLFRTDQRIHHHPKVKDVPSLREIDNVCQNYISIHGSYPDDIRHFWSRKGSSVANQSRVELSQKVLLRNFQKQAPLCDKKFRFNPRLFIHEWNYEPKPCIGKPYWNTKKQAVIGGVYSGRQENPANTNNDEEVTDSSNNSNINKNNEQIIPKNDVS